MAAMSAALDNRRRSSTTPPPEGKDGKKDDGLANMLGSAWSKFNKGSEAAADTPQQPAQQPAPPSAEDLEGL